jgi:TolB-like protein
MEIRHAMSARSSLFAELKRRNAWRAAMLYAGTVWAFGQGLSQFSQAVGLPDWATRWFLIAAAIGFPFWIAFAWFYEFTPEGLKRESEIEIAAGDSIAHATGRKLDKWIIGVLLVAVVLLLTNTFVWRKGAGLGDGPGSIVPAKSIAVLPFEDLSPAHDHGYFSAGMAEELLNALARVQDLRVAGRASSFYYGNHNADLRTIGKALDVANVLEGSVRTQGQAVRISVQLIRTHDGFEAWSQSHDGNLSNIFDLQERIARAMGRARTAEARIDAALVDDPANPLLLFYKSMLRRREGDQAGALAYIHRGGVADSAFGALMLEFYDAAHGDVQASARDFANSTSEMGTKISRADLQEIYRGTYGDGAQRQAAWQIVAAHADDNWAPTMLLQLGAPARSFDLYEHGHSGLSDAYLNWLWQPEPWSRKARRDPAFQGFAQRLGMLAYWKQYGWPDLCKPTPARGAQAFVCS